MAAASAPLNCAITRVGSFEGGDGDAPDDSPSGLSHKANSEMRASNPALTASERPSSYSSAAATPVAMIGTSGGRINQRVKAK